MLFGSNGRRKSAGSLALLTLLGVSACIPLADPRPELTSLEIQSIQKRDFDVNHSIAFGECVVGFPGSWLYDRRCR